MENLNHENEQLRKQVSERDQTIQELTLKSNQLDDKKKELKSEDDRKNREITTMQEELQKSKTELTQAHESLKLSNKKIKEITEERDQYKLEAWRLTMKQKNASIKYATVGIGGVVVGTAVGWWLWGNNKNPTLPVRIEYEKHTGTPNIPILQRVSIQPGIHRENSGVHSAGIRYIGFGKGVGIVISPALQKYTRRT